MGEQLEETGMRMGLLEEKNGVARIELEQKDVVVKALGEELFNTQLQFE
jgi:hypothetical protein